MNCKPGDLAVIFRGAAFSKYIGAVVRVVETDGQFWSTEKSLDGNEKYPILVPDSCLRPIRDPGDDAQDETLQWLPEPSTVKEAA
ncbi:hypothetical protein [Acidovorax sp.]|uniref:hypothetical protein n=1 Tax=Acidovorax sp. TaxID=1872122 RepID=UPI00391B0EFA